MIECRGLTKDFGDTRVVDGVTFEVAAGETLVLIGASGSGKSTTLKMIEWPTSCVHRVVKRSESRACFVGRTRGERLR